MWKNVLKKLFETNKFIYTIVSYAYFAGQVIAR